MSYITRLRAHVKRLMIANRHVDYYMLDKACAYPGDYQLKGVIVRYRRKQRTSDLWTVLFATTKLVAFVKSSLHRMYMPGGVMYMRALESFNKLL